MKIPEIFPAVATDLFVHAVEKSGTGRIVIQMEMGFAERLDGDRLASALDLVLDAEPLLGCRFETDAKVPFWRRLYPSERDNFTFVENEREYLNFRHSGQDCRDGPQLRGCLWSKSGGDNLLLKVCHEVSDAGGLKDVAAKLSRIYNRLESDPAYKPEPNISGRRGIDQITERVPLHAYPFILYHFIRDNLIGTMSATLRLPLPDGPAEPLTYVIKEIPASRVERIAAYGREREATINDLLITATYRALIEESPWDGKSSLRLRSTMDLRQWFLKDGDPRGICNLSLEESPNLGKKPGDSFDETLSLISRYTKDRLKNWRCLSEVCVTPIIKFLPYNTTKNVAAKIREDDKTGNRFSDCFTNMGVIHAEEVNFGVEPRTARLLAPFWFPPLFIAGLSGYKGRLTYSVGIPAHAEKIIERFCEAVLEALPS